MPVTGFPGLPDQRFGRFEELLVLLLEWAFEVTRLHLLFIRREGEIQVFHPEEAGLVDEVRRLLSPQERERLRAAMSYPEDTVGARMDFDLVTVREDVKLEVVLRYLRRFEELPQHTDQVFVVDRYDNLKGSLPIDQLLINEPDARVAEVMRRDVLALHGLDDVSEAAQAFERYDLVSAPVVDPHGHLIGRLTIDEPLMKELRYMDKLVDELAKGRPMEKILRG